MTEELVTHQAALDVVRAIPAGDTLWRERVALLWRYVQQQEAREVALSSAPAPSHVASYRSWAECGGCGSKSRAVRNTVSAMNVSPRPCAHPWHDGVATEQELLGRPYQPPQLFIFEEVEIGGRDHSLRVACEPCTERAWSDPYKTSGSTEYRNRIVLVPYPPRSR